MRTRPAESVENGILRWDQIPPYDPRMTCNTCQHFDLESKCCHNESKSFAKLLLDHDPRKVYDFDCMRCVLHHFAGSFRDHLASEYVTWSPDELRKKRQDLEMDLSILRDHESIVKRYGPFVLAKASSSADCSKEIDLTIQFKHFYKGNDLMTIHIDDIDPSSIKVNQGTAWVTGYPRLHFNDPHHLLLGTVQERTIIKLNQVGHVDIIKNGDSFRAEIHDALALLQRPGSIDSAFRIIKENRDIVDDIKRFLRQFILQKTDLVAYNIPWDEDRSMWDTFSDITSFKQVFHFFKKDAYRGLDIAISEESEGKRIEFIKTCFSCGDFATLVADFTNFLATPCSYHKRGAHPPLRLHLTEDDKELIKELNDRQRIISERVKQQ